MRIVAFIQDEHSIKDIMKSQWIADFRAPPTIPKLIDTTDIIDGLRDGGRYSEVVKCKENHTKHGALHAG